MNAMKVYITPDNIKQTLSLCKKLGIDTLMLGRKCLKSKEFIESIPEYGIKWSIIEPLFLLPPSDATARVAVDEDGNPAIEDWVRFVCPSDDAYFDRLQEQIEKDVALKPDGMSFDFVRFFAFWEQISLESANEQPFPKKETCFCPECCKAHKNFPTRADWRMHVISKKLKECCEIAKKQSPKILLGLHTVPWTKNTFHGALENVLGQDIALLSTYVNYISPMVYHHMLGIAPNYIEEVVLDLHESVNFHVPIIPSIQVASSYKKEKLSDEEFAQALDLSLIHI